MPATLVDATDFGLGSIVLAFEQVCALREESPVFYSATSIERGNEVQTSELTPICMDTMLFCRHILTVNDTDLLPSVQHIEREILEGCGRCCTGLATFEQFESLILKLG